MKKRNLADILFSDKVTKTLCKYTIILFIFFAVTRILVYLFKGI